MKILVTGAAGFIGFHTAEALLQRGDEVVGFDNFNNYYDPALKEARAERLAGNKNFELVRGSLEDIHKVSELFSHYRFDAVIHLAAQAGVRYSLTHPHVYIASNVTGFMNVLDEAKNAGIKRFIYASSSSVYGNNKKMPFAESDRVDEPISLYAATKKSNELTAYTYHHLYEMNVTGLRFFTVYGPWGRPDMALFTFAKNIMEGLPVDIYNFGKMRRNWTYVDDIVNGIIASLDKNYPCEVFNLGNNESVELTKFVECIEEEIGKKAEKNLLPLQMGDVPEARADISHAKEKLGFEPKTDVKEGIRNFVSWYREYYKSVS